MITIDESHFDLKETQPYFYFFVKALNLKIGDKIGSHEYIIWNNQMWMEFGKINNTDRRIAYKEFLEFLIDKCGNETEQLNLELAI